MSRREHLIALMDDVVNAAQDGCEDSSESYADRAISILAGFPNAPDTPPHEQQNEPSSSPSRAPGDEPAERMVVRVLCEAMKRAVEGALSDTQIHGLAVLYAADIRRAGREPRTSEARGFRTDGPGVMDR